MNKFNLLKIQAINLCEELLLSNTTAALGKFFHL